MSARRAPEPDVRFYTKPGCCLCDVAMDQLRPVADELGVTVHKVNIETDPELYERFKHRIPVVTIDGNAVFTYRVDPVLAREFLERALARRSP